MLICCNSVLHGQETAGAKTDTGKFAAKKSQLISETDNHLSRL